MPSTRCGETLSPLSLTIRSFLRSVMTIRPLSSRWPTSPVASQPSCEHARGFLLVVPIAVHDVLAADHDLAVLGDAHLGVEQRRADRLHADAGLGPVAADHRPGLGLAVALQQGEPERLEEQADVGIERRAARDHRLDPPAELRRAPSCAGSATGCRPSAGPTAIELAGVALGSRSAARGRADRRRARPPSRSSSGSARAASRTAAARRP